MDFLLKDGDEAGFAQLLVIFWSDNNRTSVVA